MSANNNQQPQQQGNNFNNAPRPNNNRGSGPPRGGQPPRGGAPMNNMQRARSHSASLSAPPRARSAAACAWRAWRPAACGDAASVFFLPPA